VLIISENLWNEIKNVIPEKKSKVGRPKKNPDFLSRHILRNLITGVQWHKLPAYYGRPTTIHGRFRAWIKSEYLRQFFVNQLILQFKNLAYLKVS